MAVFGYFIVVWIGENTTVYGTPENKFWLTMSRYSTIGLFSLFLLVYILVLVVLSRRLKKYFPKFFQQEKFKIILATGAIVLAIVSRIATNIWLINNVEEINNSFDDNSWLYPAY
jgi:hypothetical protein